MLKVFLFLAILFTMNIWAKTYPLLEERPDLKNQDVTVIASDKGLQSEVIVQFHVGSMEVIDEKVNPIDLTFQKIIFKELKLSAEEGQPQLPYHSILVYGEPTELMVDIKKHEGQKYQDVIPSPAPRYPKRCGPQRDEEFKIDWVSYQTGGERFFNVEKIGSLHGRAVSRVSFYPIQFFGMDRGIDVYPRMTAVVWDQRGEGVELFDENSLTELVEDQVVLNNRYIVLTPKRFESSLSELIEWKRKLGFQVVVYQLENVGSSFQQIKTFLQNLYKDENSRYSFALLVGDEDVIPTDYRSTSGSYRTPSDLSYFAMGGESDYIPDVYYGRLVVSTPEDIVKQTKKLLDYEKGYLVQNNGFTKGIGIASNEGYNPSDVDYVKSVNDYFTKAFGTSFDNFFQANSDAVPANVNKSLSNGAMWVTYLGHGSGTAWASLYGSQYYTTTHIKSILPGSVKPVIIDVACMNGRFKKGTLGERFMNEENQGQPVGATAYYGGSVNISWHPPAIMARGIAKVITENRPRYIGQALIGGQIYLTQNWSNLKEVIDNFEWYHLFGDPSMVVRVTVPKSLNVAIEGSSMFLTDDIGKPAEKVAVVFRNQSESFKLWSDDQGRLVLPTSTGYNYAILDGRYKFVEGRY